MNITAETMVIMLIVPAILGLLWIAEWVVHLPKKWADARQARDIVKRMNNRKG